MWDFIFVFSEERKVISFGPPLPSLARNPIRDGSVGRFHLFPICENAQGDRRLKLQSKRKREMNIA